MSIEAIITQYTITYRYTEVHDLTGQEYQASMSFGTEEEGRKVLGFLRECADRMARWTKVVDGLQMDANLKSDWILVADLEAFEATLWDKIGIDCYIQMVVGFEKVIRERIA